MPADRTGGGGFREVLLRELLGKQCGRPARWRQSPAAEALGRWLLTNP